MGKDISYLYRKEEVKKNGSYYLKKNNEKPQITPYEYGAILEKKKKYNKTY